MFSVRCDQRHHTLSFVANKRKRKKGRKKAGRARERERRKSEREREKKRKSEREKKKDERCIYKMHIFNYLTQYKCDDFLHQVMRNSILLQFKNMEFHILT